MVVVYWWDQFMVRCLSNGVRETDQRNYSKENHRLLVEEVRGGRLLGVRQAREEKGGEVRILKGWEVEEIAGKYATMLKR